MKKLILILSTIISFQFSGYSQGCLPEGITFTTQEQIDNFQVNYPGCTEIEGDVVITGIDITDLEGLNVVNEVWGDFTIFGTSNLTDLSGLENIEIIGGSLVIGDNDEPNSVLVTLNGLNNLDSIGHHFTIINNDLLSDLAGFDNLKYVNHNLTISGNSNLLSLEGIESLEEVGGNLNIREYNIEDLHGLDGLKTIGWQLIIEYCSNLINLNGLDSLQTINNKIYLKFNTALQNVEALSNLNLVNGEIRLEDNWWLLSLSGFDNIDPESITELRIYNNVHLSWCNTDNICYFVENYLSQCYIDGNADDCETTMHLAAACDTNGCLPEGINFYTQSAIDNFHLNYPGCNEIYGNVRIAGDQITNLNALNYIYKIHGNLEIWDAGQLTTLDGLENLVFVGGTLDIWTNDQLIDIAALENLAIGSLNGLIIENNQNLSNCAIASVCNFLSTTTYALITGNGNGCANVFQVLTACDNYYPCYPNGVTFNNQKQIDDFPINYPLCNEILGDLVITGPGTINNLNSLYNLDIISGSMIIENQNSLSTLLGLNGINYIYGNLTLDSLKALKNILSFNGLETIAGDLEINQLDSLTSLAGLLNLSSNSIEGLKITNNPNLSNCHIETVCDYLLDPNGIALVENNSSGCDSVAEVLYNCGYGYSCLPDGITFNLQQQINDFNTSYPLCHEIEGDVTIMGSTITNLNGLNSINTIKGDLNIIFCSNLDDLQGLENLEFVLGNFTVSSNTILQNLNGLDNLNTIGKSFEISNNNNLISFDGLNSVNLIGKDLTILNNPELIGITSLINLTEINGSLKVSYNDKLNALIGLDEINNESISELIVTNNSQLSECDINSVCQFLTNPSGPFNISVNSNGCNSPVEVLNTCLTINENYKIDNIRFMVFPNPATETISITANNHQQINVVNIYDLAGELVLNVEKGKNEIDIRSLKPGMYLLEVIQTNHAYRSKLIIQ